MPGASQQEELEARTQPGTKRCTEARRQDYKQAALLLLLSQPDWGQDTNTIISHQNNKKRTPTTPSL